MTEKPDKLEKVIEEILSKEDLLLESIPGEEPHICSIKGSVNFRTLATAIRKILPELVELDEGKLKKVAIKSAEKWAKMPIATPFSALGTGEFIAHVLSTAPGMIKVKGKTKLKEEK